MKRDCWAKGGGKEGSGPRQRAKGEAGSGKAATDEKPKDSGEYYAYSAIEIAAKASGGGHVVRLLDTGASRHFEPDVNNFINIREAPRPYHIELADGTRKTAKSNYPGPTTHPGCRVR